MTFPTAATDEKAATKAAPLPNCCRSVRTATTMTGVPSVATSKAGPVTPTSSSSSKYSFSTGSNEAGCPFIKEDVVMDVGTSVRTVNVGAGLNVATGWLPERFV
eukprot:scaffold1060_cov196-Amphora_coffeaeformis.AAC.9